MKVAIKFLLIALFAICCAYVGNAEVVVDEDFDNALDGEVSSESNKRELVEDLGGRDLKDEDHATEEVRDLGEERELWPWYHNIFHKKRKHYGKKKSNSKKKSSSSSSSSDGKKKKRRRRRRKKKKYVSSSSSHSSSSSSKKKSSSSKNKKKGRKKTHHKQRYHHQPWHSF
eukprot:CAMPEP_0178516946 /NCGR_PEP_ID=MMETSP0696-20121128/25411_1 /TAXON_ID=265572 /ORGANISM="Extubocellulus spinifer, Strain CCMP396" /LENGTH=170 /DNA_ID=CAMNT_0020147309 /DNA_START=36 /DNA_END=548 /DNA_ORIENTATION=-